MAEIETVLAQALEDMKVGRERTVPDYLQLVPEPDRAELAELLSAFHMCRSTAAGPDPVTPERLEHALELVDRYLEEPGITGSLPVALVELRRTRRLRRDEVVEWLVGRFGIPGSATARLRRAYHQLEVGQLPGRGLSRSLLDALGEYFKVDPDDLAAAAARGPGTQPREALVFGRGVGEAGTKPKAPLGERPAPSGDQGDRLVDRLFYGGPDV